MSKLFRKQCIKESGAVCGKIYLKPSSCQMVRRLTRAVCCLKSEVEERTERTELEPNTLNLETETK